MVNRYVSVIGSLNYDFFFEVKRNPKIGETMYMDKLKVSCGGKGANQAYQMAKLGLNVYMIGCVGNDSYGDQSIQELDLVGVHLDGIKRSENNTGLGFIIVKENGDVSAMIDKGANENVNIDLVNEYYDLIFNSDYILLQMEIPLETIYYIIQEADKKNVKVVLNPAPAQAISDEILSKVNYLVVNEVEAEYYLKEKIDLSNIETISLKLREKVKDGLVLTLGTQGSYYIDNDVSYIPIVEVKAIDTTGAGDSYIGAFVYGLMKGYSEVDACKLGALASSETVKAFGRYSMPDSLD